MKIYKIIEASEYLEVSINTLKTLANKEIKMNNKKLVQMRFNESTIKNVEELRGLLCESNRAQIVAQAIAVYKEIMKAHKTGGEIIVEYENRKERLILMS